MGLRRIIPAVLVFIAIIALLSSLMSTIAHAQPVSEILTGTNIDHDPISINTNANFTGPNGVTPGAGTDIDPHIIAGYNITAFTTEPCIQIMNTDEFVIIKDCRLYGNSSTFVEITNCSNIRFYNVSIEGDPFNAVQTGMFVDISSNVIFEDSTVTNSSMGTSFYMSENTFLSNNTFNTSAESIRIERSMNFSFSKNNLSGLGLEMTGASLEHWDTHIFDDYNLLDDKPVYYCSRISELNVSSFDVSQVILANCINATVTGLDINGPWIPLTMAYMENADVEGNIFNGSIGASVRVVSSYGCHVDGNLITSSAYGVTYNMVLNSTINANTFWDDTFSIQVDTSENITISENTATNNRGTAITIWDSSLCNLSKNVLEYNIGSGIYIEGSDNFTISDNSLRNMDNGLYIGDSNMMTAHNNTVENNAKGIYFYTCTNSVIQWTNASNNADGIHVKGGFSNTLMRNYVTLNDYGIKLESTSDNTLVSNTINQNSDYGLYMVNSASNDISTNKIRNNAHDGIFMQVGSDDNLLYGLNVSGNGDSGIVVKSSGRVNISNCDVSGNKDGIELFALTDTSDVVDCVITGSYTGLLVSNSNFIKVERTNFTDCEHGIESVSSEYLYMRDNIFLECGLKLSGASLSEWNTHSIDESNIVNSLPLRYRVNLLGGNILNGAGQVIIANCMDVTLSEHVISSVYDAITVGFSNRITITFNDIDNCSSGIYLYDTHYSSIEDNYLTDCGRGIYLDYSSNSMVTENVVFSSSTGIYLATYSAHNNIDNNTVAYCTNGIWLSQSNHNNVFWNDVTENSNGIYLTSASASNKAFGNNITGNVYGLRIVTSNLNLIYSNDFIQNSNHASDTGSNRWNRSYPLCGNHWSDVLMVDEFSGPLQKIGGPDGIGDESYEVKGGSSLDMYPWIEPLHYIYLDLASPTSELLEPAQYWWNVTEVNVSAIADDEGGIVSEVSLYYRFSENQTTWGNWTLFSTELSGVWNWTFPFGEDGYYELYTIANDDSPNSPPEDAPLFADIALALDTTPPEVNNTSPLNGTTGETFNFVVNTEDISGIASVIVNITYPDASTEEITLTASGNIYQGLITLLEDNLTKLLYNILVTDICGNENLTGPFKINMLDNDAPTAIVIGAGTYNQGTNVSLSAWTSTDNIEIIDYNWSFLYGETPIALDGMNISFEFMEDGYYSVTLRVEDAMELTHSIIFNIIIVDSEAPNTLAGDDIVVDQHTEVFLDSNGSSDNVEIQLYTWTFVYDELIKKLYGEKPSFTFDSAGSYQILLEIRDVNGYVGTDWKWVNVTDITPPTVLAGEDASVSQHTLVAFSGAACTDNVEIVNYTWTFVYNEEAVSLFGITPRFLFEDAGVYVVDLDVYDLVGNSKRDSLTITVNDITAPTACPGSYVDVPQHSLVAFDSTCSYDNVGVVDYTWTFFEEGYKVYLYGATPDHTFDLAGNFTITLVVEDGAGLTSQEITWVNILDTTDPVADPGPDKEQEQGFKVYFDGRSSSDNVAVVDHAWTFTYDGEPVWLNGSYVDYVFREVGSYEIMLKVTDSVGLFNTKIMTLNITDGEAPDADAGKDQALQIGDLIFFDGTASTDNIGVVKYTWEFFEGGTKFVLNGSSVSHTFETRGSFIVTLTVEDEAGNEQTDIVLIKVEKFEDEAPPPDSTRWIALIVVLVVMFVLAIGVVLAFRHNGNGKNGKGKKAVEEPVEEEVEETTVEE